MNIICGTGHRPNKLGGYDDSILIKLIALAEREMDARKPDQVISGMALGWDTALAIAAIRKHIPLVCAVPFKGQEKMWVPSAQERFHKILSRATNVVIVSDGGYTAHSMQVRNEWMVDRADCVWALWNGSSGGTANCIRYANRLKVPVVNFWSAFS